MKVIVACKICNKEQNFKQSSNWKRHYFSHTTQKPHQCNLCEKSFTSASLLRDHRLKNHGIADMKKEPVKQEVF